MKLNYITENGKHTAFPKHHQENFNTVSTPRTLVLGDGTFKEYDRVGENKDRVYWELLTEGVVGMSTTNTNLNRFITNDTSDYLSYILMFFERYGHHSNKIIGLVLGRDKATVSKMRNRPRSFSQYSRKKFFELIMEKGEELCQL